MDKEGNLRSIVQFEEIATYRTGEAMSLEDSAKADNVEPETYRMRSKIKIKGEFLKPTQIKISNTREQREKTRIVWQSHSISIKYFSINKKLFLCLTNKALRHEGVWWSGCIGPRFLHLGTEWSASRPGRFTPGERAPCTHWIGGWVDPRACLDNVRIENS
jgi:hypothetical protein